MESESTYELPSFAVNENGWGPSTLPDDYKDLPYSFFSRDENLGMIMDLTQVSFAQNRGSAESEQGDNAFTTIDVTRTNTNRKTKLIHTKTNRNYNNANYNNTASGANKGRGQQKKNYNSYQRRNYDTLHIPSIPIKPTWKKICQMDFSDLAKLSTKVLPTATTFAECGSYNDYNPQYDLISVKKPVNLESHKECGDLHSISVMKDPFLSQVSDKNVATVYTTDVALAHLMVAIRSQLSWDLEIIKNAHGIFISHRDGVFDTYTVNETSADLPTEEENKDNCLRTEATAINRDFAKQIMAPHLTKCAYPSPFSPAQDEDPAAIHRMYRYRKFQLSDTQSVLVRTEVHGAQQRGGKAELFNAYAVNEWCPRTPLVNRWRSKMETSSGYALAEDMKNNNFRLSKWGVQAILAGVDRVKIGFVSRRNMNNLEAGHVILGVQTFSLDAFTKQIMLNEKNMWATLEYVVKEVSKQEDGNYVMLKDPVKGILHLYAVSEEDMTKIDEAESESESEYSEYSSSSYSEYSYSEDEE
ncbi:hypothetical protein BLSTO_04470 [Blastocystis sp. subtype 1]